MIQNKKVFIVAGEASGDIIGAKIIDSLKREMPHIEFKGIGGREMERRGLKSILPIEKLSIMGFAELIPHLLKFAKYLKHTEKKIKSFNPDIVITIDFPGFNFRLVKKLKNQIDAKFVHIVAPSVWAYNPQRSAKVAKLYDLLLTLLPFEPPYFTKYGLKTEYIGHPIFEQDFSRNPKAFKKKHQIPAKAEVICVTPGSRDGEIKKHMAVFAKALSLLGSKYKIFVLFTLNKAKDKVLVEQFMQATSLDYTCVLGDEKLDSFAASDVALAKSGTNVLEILASGTPAIVAYKVNFLTYLYMKSKVLVKFVNLVNIIANQEIIPEFIQSDCSPVKLANGLAKYIENDKLAEIQVEESRDAMKKIGLGSKMTSSSRAAKIIVKEFLSI